MNHSEGPWCEARSDFSHDFIARTRLDGVRQPQTTTEKQLAGFACGEIATGQWPSPAFVKCVAQGESTDIEDSLWMRLEAALEYEAVACTSAHVDAEEEAPFGEKLMHEVSRKREEERCLQQLRIRLRMVHLRAQIANGTAAYEKDVRDQVLYAHEESVDHTESPINFLSKFSM